MQPGAGREAQLDRELQRMVSGPGYTVEVVSEETLTPRLLFMRHTFSFGTRVGVRGAG